MDTAEARSLLVSEQERLRGLRERSGDALAQTQEGSQEELSTFDQHEADVGTELHDMEVSQTVVEQLDARLEAVEAALSRVEEGTYGYCQQCGQPIDDERLRAMPTARYCAEHEPAATVAE